MTRSCHDPTLFTLQLSSAGEDVVRPSTEVKMADTSPLPLSGEKMKPKHSGQGRWNGGAI